MKGNYIEQQARATAILCHLFAHGYEDHSAKQNNAAWTAHLAKEEGEEGELWN